MIRSYDNLTPRYDADGVVLEPPPTVPAQVRAAHFVNFAATETNANIDAVAAYVGRQIDSDAASRGPFEAEAQRIMKLLGTGTEADPDELDYPEGDTSTHVLLAMAHTRFMARTLAEIAPPERIARAKPVVDLGAIEDPNERQRLSVYLNGAQRRVEDFYYDYYTKRLDPGLRGIDRWLSDIGLFGVGHRKIYRNDTSPSTPVCVETVPVEDMLFSYVGRRRTHIINMPAQELVRRMNSGEYRMIDIAGSTGLSQSPITQLRDKMLAIQTNYDSGQDVHALAEVHCDLWFEGDPHPSGLARPYIVTIHTATNKILAFRRNWIDGDVEEKPIQHFVTTVYHPGHKDGTGQGLGQLLTNQTDALTRTQRRAVDAGMLANKPVGFKHASFTIRNDANNYIPGTLIDVDSPAQRIQDAVMLHPFKGPDPGLMQLMDRMEQQGEMLGGVATMDFEQMMKSGVASGPAMAAFDQSHEFDTAVHRRIYAGFEEEICLVHNHFRAIYGRRPVPFGDRQTLQPDDLIVTKAVPAMRPGHVTRQRRILEAEGVYAKAATHPDQHDMREVLSFYYSALGVEDYTRFFKPGPEQAKPADMVTEYAMAMRGEPLKAGPAQNHAAHVDGHLAQLQGLESSQMPVQLGQQIATALAAHIAEHIALELAVGVASATGIPLEAFMNGMPPEIEVQIAPMVAQAVAMVEQMRAKPTDADIRLEIEKLRAANKLELESIRANVKIAEAAQDANMGKREVAADILMNREDNATALMIAGIKEAGKGVPATDQPVRAPTNNPDPNPMRGR